MPTKGIRSFLVLVSMLVVWIYRVGIGVRGS
jgi:hypothetical protein